MKHHVLFRFPSTEYRAHALEAIFRDPNRGSNFIWRIRGELELDVKVKDVDDGSTLDTLRATVDDVARQTTLYSRIKKLQTEYSIARLANV